MKTEMVKRLEKTMKEGGYVGAITICALKEEMSPDGTRFEDRVVERKCEGCEREIWVSPRSIEMESVSKLYCRHCAKLVSVGRRTETVITKESLEEQAKETGDDPKDIKARLRLISALLGTGPLYRDDGEI